MSASSRASEIDLGRLREVCSTCSLRDLCLPMGLREAEMKRLEGVVEKTRPMKSGEHLFRAQNAMRSIYAVRSGTYKSYIIDSDGEEQVLGFHLPGELMGLDAIHPGRHQCNVVALDTATACVMPFEELSQLAGEISGLQRQIMRLLSKEITSLVPVAADHSAETRLAIFLLSLSRRFGERGYSPHRFRLAMPRRDIANYLRLATETVSRVLRRFQDEGYVTVERREIILNDLNELGKLAGDASSTAN